MRFVYLRTYIKQDSIMRQRFEQQMTLGRLLIHETDIPTKKRSGALPELCAALKEICGTGCGCIQPAAHWTRADCNPKGKGAIR